VPGRRADAQVAEDDLQTECALCNETVRDEIFDPITLPELQPTVYGLPRTEKARLLGWLTSGKRTPSKVEKIYADAKRLRPSERVALIAELQKTTRL
jgi:hypothetical protein